MKKLEKLFILIIIICIVGMVVVCCRLKDINKEIKETKTSIEKITTQIEETKSIVLEIRELTDNLKFLK